MSKSPEVTAMLDGLAIAKFGRSRSVCLANEECVQCGGPAKEFTDETSRKEYGMSCFCQTCQDAFFGPGPGYVNQD